MATTNQDLKRVISNPEAIIAESDREDKKTRVEHDEMINTAALENQSADIIDDGEQAPDQSGFPISATMSQDGSRLSSLSGEEGSNSDDDFGEEEAEEEDGGRCEEEEEVPPKKESSGRIIKRQVSRDGSMSNSNSNSSSQNRQSSVTGGNWGWFEDVHGHEHSAASGGESFGGGDGNKELKKSGIWKMGSDLMQSALEAIIEPQKEGKGRIFRHGCFRIGVGCCEIFSSVVTS